MDNQTLEDLADLIMFDQENKTDDPFYLPIIADSSSTSATKVSSTSNQLNIPEMVDNKKKRKLSTKKNNGEKKPRTTAVRDTGAFELKKPTEIIYLEKEKNPVNQLLDIAVKNNFFFTIFPKGNERVVQITIPTKQ